MARTGSSAPALGWEEQPAEASAAAGSRRKRKKPDLATRSLVIDLLPRARLPVAPQTTCWTESRAKRAGPSALPTSPPVWSILVARDSRTTESRELQRLPAGPGAGGLPDSEA